jgi:hypothetical protein
MTTPIDALVLNARLRQSLETVRSLGRRGLAVAAMDTMADVPAFRDRFVAGCTSASRHVARDVARKGRARC